MVKTEADVVPLQRRVTTPDTWALHLALAPDAPAWGGRAPTRPHCSKPSQRGYLPQHRQTIYHIGRRHLEFQVCSESGPHQLRKAEPHLLRRLRHNLLHLLQPIRIRIRHTNMEISWENPVFDPVNTTTNFQNIAGRIFLLNIIVR